MELSELIVVLFFHFATASLAVAVWCAKAIAFSRLCFVLASVATLSLVAHLGFIYQSKTSYLNYLFTLCFVERNTKYLIMTFFGVSSGFVWFTVPWFDSQKSLRLYPLDRRLHWKTLVVGLSLLGSLFATTAIVLHTARPSWMLGSPLTDSRFAIEEIAQLSNEPICMVINDQGEVFVSHELHLDGREAGEILRFHKSDSNDSWESNSATSGLTSLLARPFGMAWKDGEIYVSRSGRFLRATADGIKGELTGAITRLRDLDGDGTFEDFLDVVDGLPGVQLPDSQHGNNGIAFDSQGRMIALVGSPGDRHIPELAFEGTAVRYSSNFSSQEVLASGFRNPFGIAIDPRDDRLFVTDQDVHANPGDEVNHVVKGGHYGHPYVTPKESATATGFIAPIYVGPPNGNLTGLTIVIGEAWPEEYRGCLFVADLAKNAIVCLRPGAPVDGVHSTAAATHFATVPRPVAVATTASGELFVATRRPDNRIYRIFLK